MFPGRHHQTPHAPHDHTAHLQSGDAHAVPDGLMAAIQCPVCDYAYSFVARDTILLELACRVLARDGLPRSSLCEGDSSRSPTAAGYQVSFDYVMERLLDVCSSSILDVFPASEIRFSASNEDERSSLEQRTTAKPISHTHHTKIVDACRRSFKAQAVRSTAMRIADAARHFGGEATVANVDVSPLIALAKGDLRSLGAAQYHKLVPYETRKGILHIIRVMQEMMCQQACGPAIKRPAADAPAIAAGFNAMGKRIRVHDHFTFEESEALRKKHEYHGRTTHQG